MNQYQTYPQNTDKETKINLTNLIYFILCRWRSIILLAFIIGAIFFGAKLTNGFHAMGSENLSESQKEYERSYEEYLIVKSQLEGQAIRLAQAIKEKEDYQHQSILMNLNPNAMYKSTLTYAVKDITDMSPVAACTEASLAANRKINSILGAYESLIQSGTILQNIQKEIGKQIDKKYLTELIYIQTDYQSKLLHITVLGDGEKQAQAISDAIKKEIQNAGYNISTALGDHQLELISYYIGNDVDTSISIGEIPEYGRNEDTIYQTSIEKLQKNDIDFVSDLKNQLMDCNDQLSELTEPSKPGGTTRAGIIKSSIKFGILGFIVGAFVMAYFYILLYVGSGKLMTSDEMQDIYGIPLLAYYKAPISKHTNAIDNLINRVYGISDQRFCLSDAYALAASNVLARIEDADNTEILLAGNADTEAFNSTASGVSEKLIGTGIEVITAGNISENCDAIQKLQKAEKIVLIEQAGVSRKKDIKRELQTLRDLKKEIVGAIVL